MQVAPTAPGGGGDGIDQSVSIKDYVDARTDAVESRINLKLSGLATKGSVWGAAGTVLGIILAVLAFGSDRFNGGLSVSLVVAEAQKAQAETDKKQDAQLAVMNDKLDILIKQTAGKR